jgi:hypothetical protein
MTRPNIDIIQNNPDVISSGSVTVSSGSITVTSAGVAGENHLGQVGGHTKTISVTPTLTVHSGYVSGDFVGTTSGIMTFANAARVNLGGGMVIAATLQDSALQSKAMELWLFSSSSVTPPADSAAWTISDEDSRRCIGVIPFSTYYASALNSVSVGTMPNGGIPFVAVGGSAIYGCLVTRDAPTYADGDLTVRIVILQD